MSDACRLLRFLDIEFMDSMVHFVLLFFGFIGIIEYVVRFLFALSVKYIG